MSSEICSKKESNLHCNVCAFTTNRRSLMERHKKSTKHKRLTFYSQFNTSTGSDIASHSVNENLPIPDFRSFNYRLDDTNEANRKSLGFPEVVDDESSQKSDSRENSKSKTLDLYQEQQWFPFESKIEMLLYIFMNSLKHPVVSTP